MNHSFSIIIANYNYAEHVAQAIQSCLAQDYPTDCFEVIVVDDGSTDNSRDVIAEISSKNKNLRVIQQNNLGQAAAFFAGINLASFDWVCLLDSDDYFKPEKLSVLSRYIDSIQGDCDFICHDVDALDEVAGRMQSWFARQNIKTDSLSIDDAQGGYPYANPCGQVYRKTLLQKIAPWINTAEWMRGADNPLVWGAMFISGHVHYLQQSLAVYRIHANNFFLASTSNGLVPKVNWLERWPKLLAYLRYLHQCAASCYKPGGDRDALLVRLEQFYEIWEKRLRFKPGVPVVSFITTCKNRLDHLKQTLPLMVKQTYSEVIVVDYGCTEGTRDWVKAHYPQVKVVEVDDDPGWCVARARNIGAKHATSDWLCFIDADVMIKVDLVSCFMRQHNDADLYLPLPRKKSLTGTCIIKSAVFNNIGGYDEAFRGWGGEDTDLYERMISAKYLIQGYSSSFMYVIEHDDTIRAFGDDVDLISDMSSALKVELLYRTVKQDLKKIADRKLDLSSRLKIIRFIKKKIKTFEKTKLDEDGVLKLVINDGLSNYQRKNFQRSLVYVLKGED